MNPTGLVFPAQAEARAHSAQICLIRGAQSDAGQAPGLARSIRRNAREQLGATARTTSETSHRGAQAAGILPTNIPGLRGSAGADYSGGAWIENVTE